MQRLQRAKAVPGKPTQPYAEMGIRLLKWALEEFGTKAEAARKLKKSQSNLDRYFNGQSPISFDLEQQLREFHANVEEIKTGKKQEAAKPQFNLDDQAMLELLKDRGIRTAADLEQCISDREKLRRALGPVAYQTFVETAVAVGEKQARFRRKRKN